MISRQIPSAVGMVVDPEEGALWVCAANSSSGEDPEIVGVALADGAELARHPFAGGAGFCNDLVLDPDGNLYATDSFGDRLMVLAAADRMTDGSEATEWLSDTAFESDGFGLNGGAAKVVTVVATSAANAPVKFEARVRIDTPKEREYYQHGGILQYVIRQLAGQAKAA